MAAQTVKQRMTMARDLLTEKRYSEARALIADIDYPIAMQWRNKIDAILQKQAKTAPLKQAAATQAAPNQGTLVTRDRALKLVGSVMVAGAIIGGLLYVSSMFIYLIFGSIIAAAAFMEFVFKAAIKQFRVRHTMTVVLAGLLMGVVMYGAFWYVGYLDFRGIIAGEAPHYATPADTDRVIDEILVEETGNTGLVGYVQLSIQEGMSVSRVGGIDSEGNNIGSTFTGLYYLLELAIVIGYPVISGLGQIKQPYCASDDDWLLFTSWGRVEGEKMEEFLGLLQMDRFEDAKALMSNDVDRIPYLDVRMGKCSGDDGGLLRLVVQKGGRDGEKEVLTTYIDGAHYQVLVPKKAYF